MSAEIKEITDHLVTARITGRLTQPELWVLQEAAGQVLRQQGKASLLILVEDFEGWQRGGRWDDLTFSMGHDAQIEKLAIVGDRKWEDLALLFAAKGLRNFPIEYFAAQDMAKARAWLNENSEKPETQQGLKS